MKKTAKRYQGGGLAGIAKTAQDLMGQVDNAANVIKTGEGSVGTSTNQPSGVGFTSSPMLKPAVQPVSTSGSTSDRGVPMLLDLFKKSGLPFKKGGKVKSASARADGIAIRGKTRA